MSKYVIVIIMMSYFFTSCESKKDNEIIYEEFKNSIDLKSDAEESNTNIKYYSTTSFDYNRDDILTNINHSLDNRQYGHYFKFDTVGFLKTYYYLLGDSLHQSLEVIRAATFTYSEKGTPFVDYMPNAPDSIGIKYSLLFSQFPRKNLNVSFSLDGHEYSFIDLHNSSIMPLLKESDIRIISNTKNVYLRIDASELCLKLGGLANSKVFYDTIRLN